MTGKYPAYIELGYLREDPDHAERQPGQLPTHRRAAASRATAQRCLTASPGAASAATRCSCATKAAANTSAIICINSSMSPYANVCAPVPIDAQLRQPSWSAVAPAEIDALSPGPQEFRCELMKPCGMPKSNRFERLRYQAALAERQFHRVDPDNRLVAGELERRWEAALIELRRAEEALARSTASTTPQPVGVDPRLRAKVVALGERLPALWADPATRRSIARHCCAA